MPTINLLTEHNNAGAGADPGGSWTQLSGPTVTVGSGDDPTVNIVNFNFGQYVFEYTITDPCGTSTSTLTYNYYDLPVITVPDVDLCTIAGAVTPSTLVASVINNVGGGPYNSAGLTQSDLDYTWILTGFGPVQSGIGLDTLAVSSGGSYVVSVSIPNTTGCTSADFADVTELPNVYAGDISNQTCYTDQIIDVDSLFANQAVPVGASEMWTFTSPLGTTGNLVDPTNVTFELLAPAEYLNWMFQHVVTLGGCTHISTVNVQRTPEINIDFIEPTDFCVGSADDLIATVSSNTSTYPGNLAAEWIIGGVPQGSFNLTGDLVTGINVALDLATLPAGPLTYQLVVTPLVYTSCAEASTVGTIPADCCDPVSVVNCYESSIGVSFSSGSLLNEFSFSSIDLNLTNNGTTGLSFPYPIETLADWITFAADLDTYLQANGGGNALMVTDGVRDYIRVENPCIGNPTDFDFFNGVSASNATVSLTTVTC